MQATEPVEQEVYPLGMVHHRGSLYLIAWSSRRFEVRNYKVDRIDEAAVQNLQYTVPADFDLGAWLSKSFGVWRSGSEDLQTIRSITLKDIRDVLDRFPVKMLTTAGVGPLQHINI